MLVESLDEIIDEIHQLKKLIELIQQKVNKQTELINKLLKK